MNFTKSWCKHGNTKLIDVEYTKEQMKIFKLENKIEKRFFPCYCKIIDFEKGSET